MWKFDTANANIENVLQDWDGIRKLGGTKCKRAEYITIMVGNAGTG
jgi:hypothetical protein